MSDGMLSVLLLVICVRDAVDGDPARRLVAPREGHAVDSRRAVLQRAGVGDLLHRLQRLVEQLDAIRAFLIDPEGDRIADGEDPARIAVRGARVVARGAAAAAPCNEPPPPPRPAIPVEPPRPAMPVAPPRPAMLPAAPVAPAPPPPVEPPLPPLADRSRIAATAAVAGAARIAAAVACRAHGTAGACRAGGSAMARAARSRDPGRAGDRPSCPRWRVVPARSGRAGGAGRSGAAVTSACPACRRCRACRSAAVPVSIASGRPAQPRRKVIARRAGAKQGDSHGGGLGGRGGGRRCATEWEGPPDTFSGGGGVWRARGRGAVWLRAKGEKPAGRELAADRPAPSCRARRAIAARVRRLDGQHERLLAQRPVRMSRQIARQQSRRRGRRRARAAARQRVEHLGPLARDGAGARAARRSRAFSARGAARSSPAAPRRGGLDGRPARPALARLRARRDRRRAPPPAPRRRARHARRGADPPARDHRARRPRHQSATASATGQLEDRAPRKPGAPAPCRRAGSHARREA